ncbi:MAG: hypothetical protein KatS3mg068_2513 [Candidatus Sericytochromatia bacterium]|nr:MAG: hypothetical protein KatS3mg068_2513 [Candidatus Sericytochromatia bacterium]
MTVIETLPLNYQKIKVKGEPGSIGVNFDTMNITYSVGDISATQVKSSVQG